MRVRKSPRRGVVMMTMSMVEENEDEDDGAENDNVSAEAKWERS